MQPDLLMRGDALFSDCRTYRYRLERIWDDRLPRWLFVMLNPSTADEIANDATSRRCIGFAERGGAGQLVQCNLYAIRGSEPLVLNHHPDPVGPDNDRMLAAEAIRADVVIVAWGASKWAAPERVRDVTRVLRGRNGNVRCLRMTMSGHPEHPCYLPGILTPQPYEVAA